jgi:hypothetical protein
MTQRPSLIFAKFHAITAFSKQKASIRIADSLTNDELVALMAIVMWSDYKQPRHRTSRAAEAAGAVGGVLGGALGGVSTRPYQQLEDANQT